MILNQTRFRLALPIVRPHRILWKRQSATNVVIPPSSPSHITSSSLHSGDSPPPPPPPPPRNKKLIGGGALLGVIAGGIGLGYYLDLVINDDIDDLTDRFRKKIPLDDPRLRPRIVILGTGWAALNMVRKLHKDKYDLTIVSPKNYFLFTPLLAGSTVGTVDTSSIVEPIRSFLGKDLLESNRVRFIEAECYRVDPATNRIYCRDNSPIKGVVSDFSVDYDHLVVSVGAETATFGIPGVRENACFLKEVSDAHKIRDRILDCFETASIPNQPPEEVSRLLHFVVVGGGPAGVEYAANLSDFMKRDLIASFPRNIQEKVKITLIEALPHVLNVFDSKLIEYVETKLRNDNLDLLTTTAVTHIGEKEVTIKKEDGTLTQIPYGVLVWAAGNAPRPFISETASIIGQTNKRALEIDSHLRVKISKNIWAMGDCSIDTEKRFPATAQVASQQGRYLGRLFNALVDDMIKQNYDEFEKAVQERTSFQYLNKGMFSYVGGKTAVAQLGKETAKDATGHVDLKGTTAYILWRSVYFTKLLSYRNRAQFLIDWIMSSIFGRSISRA
eukprot:TRINITY_DN18031_c0_g1_i1.p1 TRINITY_DN18031_c0_g1~~TRINITY_DN18031_c0_g1_i1.p1  ORF type:complete len:558 (-),score=84.43 TRINITY_DN18031_c0_g1_i1:24-1697(-)